MTRFFNNVKTAVLLTALMVLVMLIGGAVGGRSGLIIAFALGGVMNFVAFFFSDKLALASMRAKPAHPEQAADLIGMVQRLADNAGLPMPGVYVSPQESPNAFATGRSPRRAAVCVTHGALKLLSYEELEGVMAHELAHVKNRDTLISTVAATIAGAIFFVSRMAMLFGGGRGGRENPLGIVGLILMIILAPVAAMLIQMAISRSREFVADADGAAIAGTPLGLIGALRKLESYSKRIPMADQTPATSHMFIVQPLSAAGGGLRSLFSTHPPTEVRVAKLMELAPRQ